MQSANTRTGCILDLRVKKACKSKIGMKKKNSSGFNVDVVHRRLVA